MVWLLGLTRYDNIEQNIKKYYSDLEICCYYYFMLAKCDGYWNITVLCGPSQIRAYFFYRDSWNSK